MHKAHALVKRYVNNNNNVLGHVSIADISQESEEVGHQWVQNQSLQESQCLAAGSCSCAICQFSDGAAGFCSWWRTVGGVLLAKSGERGGKGLGAVRVVSRFCFAQGKICIAVGSSH